MPNQQEPIDFQNVFMTHDRLNRSTNLPLFHVDESKDTMTCHRIIKRVDIPANIVIWDDKQKVQVLASIICCQAQAWWNRLEIFQIDKESCDEVKACIICSFKPKHSAKTLCCNLQDLMQKPRESVYVYFAQNIKVFMRFMASKLDTMPQAVVANDVSKKT